MLPSGQRRRSAVALFVVSALAISFGGGASQRADAAGHSLARSAIHGRLTSAQVTPAGRRPSPLNGVFGGCPPGRQVCLDRLALAKRMGFGLMINGLGLASGPAAAEAYAAAAQADGVQVAWSLADESWWVGYEPGGHAMLAHYPAWAAACACLDNAGLLRFIVTTLAGLPATWGWYVADDTQLRDDAAIGPVASFAQRLKQIAPNEATLVSAWNNLAKLRTTADYVAQESYPFGLGRPVSTQQIADLAQRTEELTPGRSSFILQGFSWGDNMSDAVDVGACSLGDPPASCLPKLSYPDPAEQLSQRQTLLMNAKPVLMLWYSLPGTIGPYKPDDSSIYLDPSPEQAAARQASLASAVSSPEPNTQACVSVHRQGRRQWVLDASSSAGLGGIASLRWRYRGRRIGGTTLKVPVRAKHGQTVRLDVVDGYQQRAEISVPLSGGRMRAARCVTAG